MVHVVHRFLSCSIAILFIVQPSAAFEEGFYSGWSDAAYCAEIKSAVNSADRRLICRSPDEIDVGIGESTLSHPTNLIKRSVEDALTTTIERRADQLYCRRLTYFSRKQIVDFLQHEKHKNLLAIELRYPMVRGKVCSKSNLDELSQFAESLGYRRVLIVADTMEGTIILKDSAAVGSQMRWWLVD